MIEFKRGDILAEDAQALVNTVNCVGVMGRGIALQFKRAYPDNFRAYAAACKREEVRPGRMFVFETGRLTNPLYVINFPTKRHWRGKSKLADIEAGLVALVADVRRLGIRSIAIPPLGSGLGGLDWRSVRPLIEQAFRGVADVAVIVYEPNGPLGAEQDATVVRTPAMTPGRAALIGLMGKYLEALLDPSVTLLEIHKLMYFLQEAGQPLRLRFVRAPYGPYAENLRHVLQAVEGHFIVGYSDGGEEPGKELELLPDAAGAATDVLESDAETRANFRRVADLLEGFETPFGLELLSTVHWVVTREKARSLEDVVAAVYRWSERKGRFSKAQIGLALGSLVAKGWLLGEGVAVP